MSHYSDDSLNQVFAPQGEFIGRWLNGSQRKTAFALRSNAETMVREDGLNSTGFLTLTVGDYECAWHGKQQPAKGGKTCCPCCGVRMMFRQVHDAKEASRRINNLNRRVLSTLFKRAIIVTERHKSGAVHFHVLGSIASGVDIRTGLNFERIYRRDYRSASPALRDLWAMLRERLPGYGFGRAELLPIRKSGDAVAAYVAKYIEKNVCNRTEDDRHKKLVRYIGWQKQQLKPNEFEWNGERAKAWRAKATELAGLIGAELKDRPDVSPSPAFERMQPDLRKRIRPKALDGADVAEALGPRWAWMLTQYISAVNDSVTLFVLWDNWAQKQKVRGELIALSEKFAERREARAVEDALCRRDALRLAREVAADPEFFKKSSRTAVPSVMRRRGEVTGCRWNVRQASRAKQFREFSVRWCEARKFEAAFVPLKV